MVSVVIIKGGLGNQLFQINAGKFLENYGKVVYILSFDRGNNTLRQFSMISKELLSKDICLSTENILIWKLLVFLRTLPNALVPKMKGRSLNELIKTKKRGIVIFDGYWFFVDIKYNLIKKKLERILIDLWERNLEVSNKFDQEVKIHIRRGDYLDLKNDDYSFVGDNYVIDAINYFENKGFNHFCFVTDDIHWCREFVNQLLFNNKSEFRVANGISAEVDFASLALSNNKILANSSFSLWSFLLVIDRCDTDIVFPRFYVERMLSLGIDFESEKVKIF